MRTCDGDDDASATADDGGGATDGVVVWERRSGMVDWFRGAT